MLIIIRLVSMFINKNQQMRAFHILELPLRERLRVLRRVGDLMIIIIIIT